MLTCWVKRMNKSVTIPWGAFSEKHRRYVRNAKDARMAVAEGAIRSGKTIDHCILAAMYLELTPDKFHLASGSTIGNAKLNIGVCNGFGLESLFRGRCKWGKYRDNEALYLYTQTGEKVVIFAGGGKADSYKRILGNSYGLWIATEINEHYDGNDSRESFIKVAAGRQLAAQRPYTLWDLNPCAPQHQIYSQYIDAYRESYPGKYVYEHFTIFDNATISEERRQAEVATRINHPTWYRRDILGERAVAEGLIYTYFCDNREKHIVNSGWLASHPLTMATIGVDFGGMGSGHAFTCTGIEQGYKGLVTLAEWHHNPKQTGRVLDPRQVEEAFVDFARMCIDKYRVRVAYCDSAEQAMIMGIRNACLRARLPIEIANARKGQINDRIRFLCRMMGTDRYHIMDDCKHTIDALQSAVWDSKHTTEDRRLDNGTTNIDSIDALEYSYEYVMESMTYIGGGKA